MNVFHHHDYQYSPCGNTPLLFVTKKKKRLDSNQGLYPTGPLAKRFIKLLISFFNPSQDP